MASLNKVISLDDKYGLVDITGKTYGRLLVIERSENNRSGKSRWLCRCECGNLIVVGGSQLATGNTRSCGCLQRDSLTSVHESNKKYGDKGKRLYRIWRGIKARTLLLSGVNNKVYGGRGVEMCGEWAKDYNIFKEWALANGYSDKLTIDRIDNNGNYEPGNCRWATYKEQANNRRNNTPVTINGITRNIKQWAEITGIGRVTIKNRIKLGWDSERLLSPVRTSKGNI